MRPDDTLGSWIALVMHSLTHAFAEVLQPAQMKRLQQIDLQQRGALAFQETEVIKALQLTENQQDLVKTINADAAKEMRLKIGERAAALIKSTEVMILRV